MKTQYCCFQYYTIATSDCTFSQADDIKTGFNIITSTTRVYIFSWWCLYNVAQNAIFNTTLWQTVQYASIHYFIWIVWRCVYVVLSRDESSGFSLSFFDVSCIHWNELSFLQDYYSTHEHTTVQFTGSTVSDECKQYSCSRVSCNILNILDCDGQNNSRN